MTRQRQRRTRFALLAASALILAGCQTNAQTGGLIGAGVGALAGQAIGGNTEGTLIGAAAGAGLGYVIGNEQDKAQSRERQSRAAERRFRTRPLRDDGDGRTP